MAPLALALERKLIEEKYSAKKSLYKLSGYIATEKIGRTSQGSLYNGIYVLN